VFLGSFIQLWLIWGVTTEGFVESIAIVATLAILGGVVALGVLALFLVLRSLLKVKF
jgi:hypothetical protein